MHPDGLTDSGSGKNDAFMYRTQVAENRVYQQPASRSLMEYW